MTAENPSDPFLNIMNCMAQRRSASLKSMRPPGLSPDQVHQLIGAASTAPDHGGLKPFRFIEVTPKGRQRLADLFEAVEHQNNPEVTPDRIARVREKAFRGPSLLIMIGAFKDDLETGIPQDEQLIAAGAALQNMLLAATAFGFSSRITTGRAARSDIFRNGLELGPYERFLCFISFGMSDNPKSARELDEPQGALSFF